MDELTALVIPVLSRGAEDLYSIVLYHAVQVPRLAHRRSLDFALILVGSVHQSFRGMSLSSSHGTDDTLQPPELRALTPRHLGVQP
jgi:hypothetical protein